MSAVPAGVGAVSGKSAEAFRTISEVAFELDVPQHVLRFWETRFAQVKPVKRAGGRRYYRPEDVDLLRGIRSLLYSDGLTIKGVQKILRERGYRFVSAIGRTEQPESDGTSRSRTDSVAVWRNEASHARAVMAELARAHAAEPVEEALAAESAGVPFEPVLLDEEQRMRLEILLAELLQLKSRLRAARAELN